MINVVLVNKQGKQLGIMERLAAHKNPGTLHRAISIVLYKITEKGVEILLQKRAKTKPLWPLYWANTVCTHPTDGESNLNCAVRRLREEIGVEVKKEDLRELFTFYYQTDYNEEFSEHELDTVVVGRYEGETKLDPSEVAEVRWMELSELQTDLREYPERYAPWPKIIFKDERILAYLHI